MINTVTSILRFYKSVLNKFSPIKNKDNSIERIVNYIKCNDRFSFSGQPTKRQFACIRKEGYSIVINLAPYDLLENPLKDEASIVTELGMTYIHIPVNMLKPTQENFDEFVDAINSAPDKKIWVHCAIGMRASAFVFKYRCAILGEEREEPMWNLREIWEPFGAWKKFIFCDPSAR